MNLGNRLAVGEAVDHGADEVAPHPELTPEEMPIQAETMADPVTVTAR